MTSLRSVPSKEGLYILSRESIIDVVDGIRIFYWNIDLPMNLDDLLVVTAYFHPSETGLATVQTNYYPIPCTDYRVTRDGAIQYTFLGRANAPNVVLMSSSLATGNLPLGYQVTELWVCPNGEAVRGAFGFFGGIGGAGGAGAVVLVHRPLTNGVPLYVVLEMGDMGGFGAAGSAGAGTCPEVLAALASPVDYTKKSVQGEPVEVAVRDWLGGAGAGFEVMEEVKDAWGNPLVVVVWQGRLPGVPVGGGLGGGLGLREGMTDGATLTIPTGDDPGYSYQECSVVDVDGIEVGAGGETNYTYQVSANSNLVKGGMDVAYSNNVSGVVLYFLCAMVIYFGTPLVYRTLLCQILGKMEGGLGGSAGFVDYLRTSQNVLGLGNYRGITVLFNAVFLLVLVALGLAGRGGGTDQWSLYSTVVFLVLAWVIGYVGIMNNPLPASC